MIDSGEVEKGRKELVDIVGMRDYNGNMRGGGRFHVYQVQTLFG